MDARLQAPDAEPHQKTRAAKALQFRTSLEARGKFSKRKLAGAETGKARTCRKSEARSPFQRGGGHGREPSNGALLAVRLRWSWFKGAWVRWHKTMQQLTRVWMTTSSTFTDAIRLHRTPGNLSPIVFEHQPEISKSIELTEETGPPPLSISRFMCSATSALPLYSSLRRCIKLSSLRNCRISPC